MLKEKEPRSAQEVLKVILDYILSVALILTLVPLVLAILAILIALVGIFFLKERMSIDS